MREPSKMSQDSSSNYPIPETKLQFRIEKILKEPLNESTRQFLESVYAYYKKSGDLTERQLSAFEKIESRFSPQEKLKFESWKQDYAEHYKADALIIAKYYTKTGYYVSIAAKIMEDEAFVPNKKDFMRMYTNKYAQKVIVATHQTPKFAVGDMVQLRATIGKSWHDKHQEKLRLRKCFVLENDLLVVNAVNGAKRYRVLPLGSSDILEVDERFLMKPNKKGRNS